MADYHLAALRTARMRPLISQPFGPLDEGTPSSSRVIGAQIRSAYLRRQQNTRTRESKLSRVRVYLLSVPLTLRQAVYRFNSVRLIKSS